MKKLIVIIFIIFGAFLAFSLYRTYAYDTSVVEETPSTTDLEYTFKIGNSSIKQITIDSGETKYYDVVLGNPNPAKISYGVYYEMVSPSTKPDGFSIEYTSKSTGKGTGKVDKEGNITLNLVVTNTSSSTVTVKLGTVAGYVNGGELTLNSGQALIPQQTATSYVRSLNDNSTGDTGSGVYKIHHDAIPADSSATGEIIPAVDDYRYYGASPNNYICLDMEGQSTCPDRGLFRIIGSIYEENAGQNLIKVIKATPLSDGTTSTFSWDRSITNIWSSDTKGTTSGGSIMKLLNNIWINNGTGDKCSYRPCSHIGGGGGNMNYYNGKKVLGKFMNNNTKFITDEGVIDFQETGLSINAKVLIQEVSRYYLGGYSDTSLKTSAIYLAERSKTTSSGNSLYWDGGVGLTYPSDYGYAAGNSCITGTDLSSYDSSCKFKDWLYNSDNLQWLMSPDPSYSNYVLCVNTGDVKSCYSVNDGLISPVFYLNKDVVITSGTGTSSDPYLVSK